METENIKARNLFVRLYFMQGIAKYTAVQQVKRQYRGVDTQDLLYCALELEDCYS